MTVIMYWTVHTWLTLFVLQTCGIYCFFKSQKPHQLCHWQKQWYGTKACAGFDQKFIAVIYACQHCDFKAFSFGASFALI